jgi:hypothetical protein
MNPLEEIWKAIHEFAEAPPAARADLQPAKWTLSRSSQAMPSSPPINPALVEHVEERAKGIQNRIADRITPISRAR